MTSLPLEWIAKVAGAIGRTSDETEAMIMEWYKQGRPLRDMERDLIALAVANGKELVFSQSMVN